MKVKELITAEDKLRALYHLQQIHSKIDEINVLQGELPIEVQELEDEIVGLHARISKLDADIAEYNNQIVANRTKMQTAEAMIAKYLKQQENVKNNREFDALSKEIEMQRLDIELSKKRIRDAERDIATKDVSLKEASKRREQRLAELEHKKKELEVITAETAKEAEHLYVEAREAEIGIESRLLAAYNRIRLNYRNGLAVVTVDRDACGGCFGKIPPQRQLELKQHKKIILCEHCGRILIDADIDNQEETEN